MRTLILIVFTAMFAYGEFCKGFSDGHCEGWRDVKGQLVVCPVPPVCPVPEVNQNTYKGGYNLGFKRGIRDANKY